MRQSRFRRANMKIEKREEKAKNQLEYFMPVGFIHRGFVFFCFCLGSLVCLVVCTHVESRAR